MGSSAVERLVLLMSLVLVVSACSSSIDGTVPNTTAADGAAVESSATSNSAPTMTSESATTEATNPADANQPETLADYLDIDFFSFDPLEQMATLDDRQQQARELIAECMAKEGFEVISAYPPVDNIAEFGAPRDDIDYAREYGFGISTTFGDTDLLASADEWIDPNQAIIESLSESERAAYFDALEGTGEFDGCIGEADKQVFGRETLSEIYEKTDLESIFDRLAADPRIADIEAEWSKCMAEQGYQYENPDALNETVNDLRERFNEIVGVSEEFDDQVADTEQVAQKEVDQVALAALQTEERALAVANAGCTKVLYKQTNKLYKEHEATFVNENRAVLEQIRNKRRTDDGT